VRVKTCRPSGANDWACDLAINKSRPSGALRLGAAKSNLDSKDDLEKFNAVPFSGVVGVKCCILYPDSVARGRPRIEHLKRVTAWSERFRKCATNCWPLGNGRRRWHRADRFLSTDRCSEFLGGSSRHQRGQDCDHQCLHISLSFEACEMLPITAPVHNISFDGFS
jgi:hypothetical protein